MTELWELPATRLADGYRAREFSPREVVDALLDRIEGIDPALGAFTAVCGERARAEADEALHHDGPLAGVPFAAKDLFDSAGVRTTYGSRLFADHVPERDAAAIAALRAAGAILVGKTRTHEFAFGITTINEVMGSSRNPWDHERVPGGSSGGSGAALAARLVPLAIGSDTGGSIRIPAAFCGVAGFKPTYGRIDAGGCWPLAPSLDHAGPMARTVDDIELAFAALEGRAASAAEPGDLGGATVVVCPDLDLAALAPDIERAFRKSIETLERLGARVVEATIPGADRIEEVFRVIQGREAWQVHTRAGLYPARADAYGPDVLVRLERGAAVEPDDYVRAAIEREALRAAMGRMLEGGRLLVTPVSAAAPAVAGSAALAADEGHAFRAAVMPFSMPQNLAGLPSCAVRAGFDDLGLPVAIQLSGAPWRDRDVLRAARAFQAATPEIQSRWPATEE